MTDYKKTLNLPQTSFPMRANLSQNEPKMLAFWESKPTFFMTARRMPTVIFTWARP